MQRKHIPSNSMSDGASGTLCSRGSLASSGNQSRSKVICIDARSRRDSPWEHWAPGLTLLFLEGPAALGPAWFSCLRRAPWAGARKPGRAENPLQQLGCSEPSSAKSPTAAEPTRDQSNMWTLSPRGSVITAKAHMLPEE